MQSKNKTKLILAGISLALVSFFVSGLNTTFVSAYSASITTSNAISLDAMPTGDGTSIHSESINVQSDCRAGYNLTIATPEGSNLYAGGDGTLSASFTAVDGTSALNSSNNTNKWGYTLTNNPTSATVFSPLSTTASTLKTSSETASPSSDINDTFNINYGVKTDITIDPGTYSMANNGTIVYYLTMDTSCTQYTVAFNANGGTGTIANQAIETGAETKLTSADSLTAPTGGSYTDAGNNTITGDPDKLWTFWGWNTQIDGTGDWYKDREAVQDLTNVGSTITLYAQWKQATLADMTTSTPSGTEKVIDHNEMQDMRPEVCYNSTAYSTDTNSSAHTPYNASTNPGGYHTITLLDYRGKVTTGSSPEQPEQYTVSKLPDNLCWMTKDLNLGRTSGGANGDGTITLTSDDTDLADNTTFTLPVSPTTYATSYITPQILINHQVDTYTVNSISYSPITSYYSWAAATATDTSVTASGNIATSICPKNWDLPINIQYTNLRTKGSVTSATIAHAEPYNFIYGGYRNAANGYYNQTTYGYYWTATNSSSSYAYRTYINSSGIYSSTATSYKYYGSKLRCVASSGTATVNYDANGGTGTMPSQNNAELNSTTVSENSFTAPANRQFRNWNTRADGGGTTVTPGTSLVSVVSKGETITLYAQWDEVHYIAFNANESGVGGTPGSATGTMTNQTVIKDAATAIKTNTFALSGYMFYGWNTAADGTGTLYSDGQKVTNLATTGNTITLYAMWTNGAYLDTGQAVNQKLKRLAGNSSASYRTQDTTITAIVRSNALPNNFAPSAENTISDSSSITPIYAWYDSTDATIYYYSTATVILMNKSSSYFFNGMRALSNLSAISTWDTTKVTTMSSMFSYAGYSATTFTLNLSSWNTSSVTDMNFMFEEAGYSATTFTLNLSSWNTSSVAKMFRMFYYSGHDATTWVVNGLSSWNTSSVTTMDSAFTSAGYNASSFSLDFSSWDTSSVTTMERMFLKAGYNASVWSVGGLSNWNTSRVTNMSYMFEESGYSATTWSVGDLSSWNTSSVATMVNMFYESGYNASSFTLDLSDWNTSSVTDMYQMFGYSGYSATTWSVGDLSSWNTSSVTDMYHMFNNAGRSTTTWSVGDLSSWNTSSVTRMTGMFSCAGYSATTFTLNLSSWNTSSVTDMSYMFEESGYSATTFTLNLSSWNTSSVTNMDGMFYESGYSATTWSINGIASWNTSNVENMTFMFIRAGHNSTTFTLNLSSWNTSSVTSMWAMFSEAGSNSTTFTLNLSSWNTSSVTNISNMFSGAGSSATTWSVTIPKTNNGTASGSIPNTTSNLYGNTTSITATPPSGKSFTLAN